MRGLNFRFNDMSNIVHIDEKLFYLTLGGGTTSKSYVPKIMFMCAVAKPLFSNNGELIFDGKIGIFSFTTQVPAQRSSNNSLRREIIYDSLCYLDTKVDKNMFDIVFFHLDINDQ